MTQPWKQWATTGFILGVASGGAAVAIIFLLLKNDTPAMAQPLAAPAAMTMPSAPSSNDVLLSGTVELDSSVATRVVLPTVVFVIARAEGTQQRPVLAKRLDVRSFQSTSRPAQRTR